MPLQVFRLDPQSCSVSTVPASVRPVAPDLRFRGGTRFVYGTDVEEGAIYWALGHTKHGEGMSQARRFSTFMVAVLHRPRGTPPFELMGISCPLAVPLKGSIVLPVSIVSYHSPEDTADLTFNEDDLVSHRMRARGIG